MEQLIIKKFGFIDEKNYNAGQPTNIDQDNALYNRWLLTVLITETLAFGADGCIFWMKHTRPGSWSDGEISRGFREKILSPCQTLNEHIALADSAFPVSGDMKGKIVTPLKRETWERAINDGEDGVRIATVNYAVISIR